MSYSKIVKVHLENFTENCANNSVTRVIVDMSSAPYLPDNWTN